MITKAEAFKAEQQRKAHPPKPKRPPRPKRNTPVDTAAPGVSATDRKAGGGSSSRNASARAGKKGGASLEDSATGRPSRKSTRRSKGRIKRTSNLQRRAIRTNSSAKARANRSKARRGKR